jgi:formylglycine-generating enzyme required for sulfatase activity
LYPFNDLLKKLDKGGAGTNLVLVDACRSVNDANRGTRSGIDGSKAVSLAVGTVVFFACSRDQEARETEKADGGHGVFFHHVIDGLKGGAANKRGQVTWDGLVAHVKDQTAAAYPDWFPGLPEKRWQQPQSIGNTSGAVVLVADDAAKKSDGGKFYTSRTTGMKFVRIKADKFMMGSPREEKDRSSNEELHEVTLTKDYYMGVFEVTRGQFKQFVDEENYMTDGEADGKGGYAWDADKKNWREDPKFTWRNPGFLQSDDHPVVLVSWNDAVAFCKCLSKKDGKAYQLPTEAEWEFACRAGSSKRFSFGDDAEDLAKHGNTADADYRAATGLNSGIKASDGFIFTARVGSYSKNAFGLADMHGNAWEWCQDYYGPYDRLSSKVNPLQDIKQSNGDRVFRGGSWRYAAMNCRAAFRNLSAPHTRNSNSGFRVSFAAE